MGNNDYLIPANSKRSVLILGMFNSTDLIIVGTGFTITLILLFAVSTSTLLGIVSIIMPMLFCAFLVIPLPNQHNVRTFIKNIYNYFTGQKEYRWKGWCIRNGEDTK